MRPVVAALFLTAAPTLYGASALAEAPRPVVARIDATRPNAALLVEWALDCALGRRHMSAGAFAA